MRDQNNDVILICKGFYDYNKHANEFDALCAYWQKKCSNNYTSPAWLITGALLPVCDLHLKSWSNWIEEYLMKMFAFMPLQTECFYKIMGYRAKCNDPVSSVCAMLIMKISELEVRDNNGNVLIDLSGYEDVRTGKEFII